MVRVGKLGMLSLLAASLAAGVAVAQPPGRGGPGGFGGMGRGGGGVMALLSQEAVQKELGLNKESIEKLVKLGQDAMEETRAETTKVVGEGGFQALQGLSDSERQAMMDKMADVRKAIQAKYLPKLKEALSAEQYQRAQQIAWQAGGTAALSSDDELAKQLALTKEQQDKLAAINKEFGEKQRGLFAGAGGGRPGGAGGAGGAGGDVRAKMAELNKERDAKTTEVLSKEQQEKFATLKGKPFDLTQLQQGGPGGGGPGGRPPGATGRPQGGRPKTDEKK